jgi:hypothetical protein
MNGMIVSFKMFTEIVDLGMTVVAGCDTVICFGVGDLIEFQFSELVPSLCIAGLEVASPAATAVVVGSVGVHFDEIFLTDHRFDNKTKILCNGIPESFSHQLARILNRECDF